MQLLGGERHHFEQDYYYYICITKRGKNSGQDFAVSDLLPQVLLFGPSFS